MGFSLVGPSGDTKTNTTVYTTTNTASLNPQADQEGSGAGASSAIVAPNIQDSTDADVQSTIGSYYAPVDILSTGNVQGDSAIAALSSVAQGQTAASQGGPGTTGTLSSFLSGNTLYWILGAIVILFLAHHKN